MRHLNTIFHFVIGAAVLSSCASRPDVKKATTVENFLFHLVDKEPSNFKVEGKTYSFISTCQLFPDSRYLSKFKNSLDTTLQKLGFKELSDTSKTFLNIALVCDDLTEHYRNNPRDFSSTQMTNGETTFIKSQTKLTSLGVSVTESDGQTINSIETKSKDDKIIRIRFHIYNQQNKKYAESVVDLNGTFVPSEEFLNTSWNQLINTFLQPLSKMEVTNSELKELCVPRFGFEWEKDERRIKDVPANTPAAKAGLKKGDEVVKIQSLSAREFYDKKAKEVFENKVLVPIEILRKGKPLILGIKADNICTRL